MLLLILSLQCVLGQYTDWINRNHNLYNRVTHRHHAVTHQPTQPTQSTHPHQSVSQCGQLGLQLTSANSRELITSPNYPEPLSGQMQCTWTIVAPEGTNLKFNFVDLRMKMDRGNCRQTFVLITSMDKTLEWKLCGSNPGVIVFPANEAYVKLVADDKITEKEKIRRFKTTISATRTSPNSFEHGQTVNFPPLLTPSSHHHKPYQSNIHGIRANVPRMNQVQPPPSPPQVHLKAAVVPTLPNINDYGLIEPVLPDKSSDNSETKKEANVTMIAGIGFLLLAMAIASVLLVLTKFKKEEPTN